MKSRKVLLGLLLGICACFAGTATAQKANYQSTKLIEIGPDNIGGRVTSLVITGHEIDPATGVYSTDMYAGSATGGLYFRGLGNWEYVPCYVNDEEITLPISSMVKLNENTLVVATGESTYTKGSNLFKMAAIGRGLFLFNTDTKQFTQVANTNPGFDLEHDFASVNGMSFMKSSGVTYFFVATAKGLYRWTIAQESDWNNAPVAVFEGAVRDVEVSQQTNRAFFTSKGHVYKISDVVNGSTPIDISGSCAAFGTAAADVELAMSPEDETYLYAMAYNKNGMMTGLYMTRNTNSWQILSTSTVTPFSSVATAKTCGAIAVSPNDPLKVYIGGATVFVGKGYVENSPFQWMQTTSNEAQLNYGNYMLTCYSDFSFVHSGIHQIVADTYWQNNMLHESYYFVTDGGIYFAPFGNEGSIQNYNSGLNTVQINSLAVAPDGTIITGANSNACPIIESRMDHSGGRSDQSWYDPQGSTMNHRANIIFKGNGGTVAASRFNQYAPTSRRPLFVSSEDAFIGRTYADFADYTNTQTWNVGESFMSDMIEGGPKMGQIYLWETTNNVNSNDSLTALIDTLAYAYREGSAPFRMGLNTQIHAGDSMVVLDTAHAFYPFFHVFDHDFVVKNELRHRTHRPYLSRMLAVASDVSAPDNTYLYLSWTPTDFRKVCDNTKETRFWTHIYEASVTAEPNTYVRQGVLSQDGDCAIVVVENDSINQSYLARVHGLNSANYNVMVSKITAQIDCKPDTRITTFDKIMLNDSTHFFGRRISSVAVDPREGKDAIIVTFDGIGNDAPNVIYINNASKDNYTITPIALPVNVPVYSSLIEYTTGAVYVGTEEGVFVTANPATPNWESYGAFKGVPVTSIYQVTNDNELLRHVGHDGVTPESYIFPRTKWPFALYFGTYGRGVFMDSTFVTRHENEIVDSNDYNGGVAVPTIATVGSNSVRFYPNPAVESATMELNIEHAGEAVVNIYSISGKLVRSERLGKLAEGVHTRTIDCQQLAHGMYLVNVVMGNQTATSKLIVR